VSLRSSPWELYDLRQDRSESHDLATRYPDKVAELESAWILRAKELQQLAHRDQ
jgi:arylsulfatase